jgi:hypothetical protein
MQHTWLALLHEVYLSRVSGEIVCSPIPRWEPRRKDAWDDSGESKVEIHGVSHSSRSAKDNSALAPEGWLGSVKYTLACGQEADIVVVEVHREGADLLAEYMRGL